MVDRFWIGIIGIILIADQLFGMIVNVTLTSDGTIIGAGDDPAIFPVLLGIILVIIGLYPKVKVN